MLARLDPTARALLRRTARACRAAVESSGLQRAGAGCRSKAGLPCPLKIKNFVGSAELLAWAKVSWCRLTVSTPVLKEPLVLPLETCM